MLQRDYDLNKAAELQYGKLPQLERQIEYEEEQLKKKDLRLVHENVSRRRNCKDCFKMDRYTDYQIK